MTHTEIKKDNTVPPRVLFAVVLGHVFWGFSFMASRVALDIANMFILLSHRFLVAFLIMSFFVVFGFVKINIKGKKIGLLLLLGVLEPLIYFIGEYYGLLHTNSIFSGVMIATIPIITTLAASPILGEKPTLGQLLFCLLSVGGVVGIGLMTSSTGVIEFWGVMGLIIAVVAAAGYTLLGRKISSDFSAFERTYSMMTVGAVVFTLMAIISCKGSIGEYLEPLNHTPYLYGMLFLAIFCSVLGYFLNAYSITYLTVARQTVFANLTTAVSVFAGAIFLHEPFTIWGFLFCAMILLGIYGVQKSARE